MPCAQGVKDAWQLVDVLGRIFCARSVRQLAADAAAEVGLAGYDNFFTVHMAILTANLGKRLFVSQRCLLYCVLRSLFPPRAESKDGPKKAAASTVINFSHRLEDQCNTEIFSILNWQVVHDRCVEEGRGSIIRAKDVICGADLQALASWNNTITVTAKGAVIIRFSWDKPIRWTARHASLALQASRLVCALIENCS